MLRDLNPRSDLTMGQASLCSYLIQPDKRLKIKLL